MFANTNGLAAGTYTGQIAVTGTNQQTGATLTPVNITVTLYVSNNAPPLVTPPQPVVFTVPVNSGQPSQLQPVTLASTSTDVLNLSWGQPSVPWLAPSGELASTPDTLGLTAVPPTSLAPGTYPGSITVTATNPNGAAVLDSPATTGTIIPVVLRVTSGTLNAPSPASLSFCIASARRPRRRSRSP